MTDATASEAFLSREESAVFEQTKNVAGTTQWIAKHATNVKPVEADKTPSTTSCASCWTRH
jgi:hypothetical protein